MLCWLEMWGNNTVSMIQLEGGGLGVRAETSFSYNEQTIVGETCASAQSDELLRKFVCL